MNQRVAVILAAAGSGSRMGAALPKVLLPLVGTQRGSASLVSGSAALASEVAPVPATVLSRTLDTFLSIPEVSRVLVMISPEHREEFELAVSGRARVELVEGGALRQESVYRGISRLIQSEKSDLLVAVHDAARCFIRRDVIKRAIASAAEHNAVTVAVPAVDSIKRVGTDMVVRESLPRPELWHVQTPQIFRLDLLEHAHRITQRDFPDRYSSVTDDASLVEPFHPVRIVPGEPSNIKLTTPLDYRVAQLMIDEESEARRGS